MSLPKPVTYRWKVAADGPGLASLGYEYQPLSPLTVYEMTNDQYTAAKTCGFPFAEDGRLARPASRFRVGASVHANDSALRSVFTASLSPPSDVGSPEFDAWYNDGATSYSDLLSYTAQQIIGYPGSLVTDVEIEHHEYGRRSGPQAVEGYPQDGLLSTSGEFEHGGTPGFVCSVRRTDGNWLVFFTRSKIVTSTEAPATEGRTRMRSIVTLNGDPVFAYLKSVVLHRDSGHHYAVKVDALSFNAIGTMGFSVYGTSASVGSPLRIAVLHTVPAKVDWAGYQYQQIQGRFAKTLTEWIDYDYGENASDNRFASPRALLGVASVYADQPHGFGEPSSVARPFSHAYAQINFDVATVLRLVDDPSRTFVGKMLFNLDEDLNLAVLEDHDDIFPYANRVARRAGAALMGTADDVGERYQHFDPELGSVFNDSAVNTYGDGTDEPDGGDPGGGTGESEVSTRSRDGLGTIMTVLLIVGAIMLVAKD